MPGRRNWKPSAPNCATCAASNPYRPRIAYRRHRRLRVFTYRRIIDLTLPIVPGQGARPFNIERGRTEEITVHVPVDHPWYIMVRASPPPGLTAPLT